LEVTPSANKFKGCNLKGHIEKDYWKLHLEKHTEHFRKNKKKTLIIVDAKERVDNTLELKGKISCTNMQKEVALFGCGHKEEKDMNTLFYIKIHMK